MDAKEWGRGTGDEDAGLVYSVVGWVEGTVVVERAFIQWEEKSGCNALIYGVFGDIDQQKG